MYWDVVEVKPEPDYSLSVRFKDGVTGRVQLQLEDLTGVLAPLRDRKILRASLHRLRRRRLARRDRPRSRCHVRSNL